MQKQNYLLNSISEIEKGYLRAHVLSQLDLKFKLCKYTKRADSQSSRNYPVVSIIEYSNKKKMSFNYDTLYAKKQF